MASEHGIRRVPGFTGNVSVPGDATYERARRVWNRAADHRPALIAHCTGTADVAAALRHAADHGLPVSVRAGGHGFAGLAISDGGVVVDLRGLRTSSFDPATRTAVLGAGLRWADADDLLAPAGQVTTGGSVSHVGVAGFTLGTGLGWLGRAHGLAGDNLTAARVVTADGRTLDVDAEHERELFWALRGGCGNFGVVTAFRLRTHPLARLLAGPVLHPIEQAHDVLEHLAAATPFLDDRVNWAAVLTTAPPLPALPPELHGEPVLLTTLLYVGDTATGATHLAPLRRLGAPAADLVDVVPYSAFLRASDAAAPEGKVWDVRSEWLTGLDPVVIGEAVDAIRRAPHPLAEVLFRPLGGAISGPGAPDTPFSFRDAAYLVEVITCADPSQDPAPGRTWMEATWKAMLHASAGGPDVNHLGLGEDEARVRAAWSTPVHERLRAVKRQFDPEDVFRSVQHVRP